MSGLDIPLVKITNKVSTGDQPKRPIVVIIGRVNPSETYSSYVIHGALNYLLS